MENGIIEIGLVTCTTKYDYVTSVDFGPDGTHLALGSGKAVNIWNVEHSGMLTLVHTILGHRSEVYSMKFSLDGDFLASELDDRTVKIWRGLLVPLLVHPLLCRPNTHIGAQARYILGDTGNSIPCS